MEPIRLPLECNLESRDNTVTKDSLLTNAFIDKTPVGNYVVKRPGLNLKASGLGGGNGIYYWNGTIYDFYIIPLATSGYSGGQLMSDGTSMTASFDGITIPSFLFTGTNGVYTYKKYDHSSPTSPGTYMGKVGIYHFALDYNTGVILRSTDKVTWSATIYTSVASIVYTASTYAIINNTNTIDKYSTDGGVTWTSSASVPLGTPAAAIGGTISSGAYYTTNGFTTTACTPSTQSSAIFNDGVRLVQLITGLGTVTSTINVSADGITFSLVTNSAPLMNQMVFDGTVYIGTDGLNFYSSTNLSTWISIPSPDVNMLATGSIINVGSTLYIYYGAWELMTVFTEWFGYSNDHGANWTKTLIGELAHRVVVI